MNLRRPSPLRLFCRLTLLFPVFALLAACSGPTTMSRIEQNREVYNSWPPEIKEAVLAGKAIPGMTREMVRVALGRPAQVVQGQNAGEEVWVYRRGGTGPQIEIGSPTGGMQVGNSAADPEDAGEVMFRDGIVVRSNVLL
jgi:hypothetical protein